MASPSSTLAPHIFTCLQCFCSDFCTQAGLTKHQNAFHHECSPDRNEFSDEAMFTYCYHPHMTGTFIPFEAKYHYLTSILLGTPCNKVGKDLPPHLPPPREHQHADGSPDWYPFNSHHDFNFAWYHFVECESSECKVNQGLNLWAASVLQFSGSPIWKSAMDLYNTIDQIQHSDAPWRTYSFHYTGQLPPLPLQWMTRTYKLCTCDTHQVLHHQFANPDFKDKINYRPYKQFNKAGKHIWSNFMSGDLAWKQAVSNISLLFQGCS